MDVEAAGGEGDADESDPSPEFYGDEGGDFHMRFLALEEQRMLQEEQRQQRELEMMRFEEQRRQREERNQMEQKRLEFEQMKLKEELEELEWKKTEKASRETPAAKIKIWRDALRNTISRIPTEVIDAVGWFVIVEKLFEQLSVPITLQDLFAQCLSEMKCRRRISKFGKIVLSLIQVSTRQRTFGLCKSI